MDEPMTKARLIETLKARRAAWEAALAAVPEARMTEPGAAGVWSVKDLIVHLNYYEQWYASRMEEVLRGERHTPTSMDRMHWDERNDLVYQQNRYRPLADVLAEAHHSFHRLLRAVEAQSEAFLTEPQTFEGAPGPVRIWEMLRGDVYDHYGLHIPSLEAWSAAA